MWTGRHVNRVAGHKSTRWQQQHQDQHRQSGRQQPRPVLCKPARQRGAAVPCSAHSHALADAAGRLALLLKELLAVLAALQATRAGRQASSCVRQATHIGTMCWLAGRTGALHQLQSKCTRCIPWHPPRSPRSLPASLPPTHPHAELRCGPVVAACMRLSGQLKAPPVRLLQPLRLGALLLQGVARQRWQRSGEGCWGGRVSCLKTAGCTVHTAVQLHGDGLMGPHATKAQLAHCMQAWTMQACARLGFGCPCLPCALHPGCLCCAYLPNALVSQIGGLR